MAFQIKMFEGPDTAALEAKVNEWLQAANPDVVEMSQSESGLGVGRILAVTFRYRVGGVDPSWNRRTEEFPRALPAAFR